MSRESSQGLPLTSHAPSLKTLISMGLGGMRFPIVRLARVGPCHDRTRFPPSHDQDHFELPLNLQTNRTGGTLSKLITLQQFQDRNLSFSKLLLPDLDAISQPAIKGGALACLTFSLFSHTFSGTQQPREIQAEGCALFVARMSLVDSLGFESSRRIVAWKGHVSEMI